MLPASALPAVETFIARWTAADGSERANYQLFVGELCALLGVEPPQPAKDDAGDNAYPRGARQSAAGGRRALDGVRYE